MSQPLLTVFVLCYNRPVLGVQAIESIRTQLQAVSSSVQCVVSDNSSNNELSQALEHSDQTGLEVRRRSPSLPAIDHFNQCIGEVQTPYFMLFHDDDVLRAGALQHILAAIGQHPTASALAINAQVERAGKLAGVSFAALGAYQTIQSPRQLLKAYFGKGNRGIAPFPGYVYRTIVRDHFQFSLDEGKYSDVAYLMRVNSLGPIVWLNQALMVYRLHDGNDSNTESRRDRLKFLAFLKKHPDWCDQSTLVDYRYFIVKRLSDLSRPSCKAAKRHLKCRRILRVPDFAEAFQSLRLRLTGKRKNL